MAVHFHSLRVKEVRKETADCVSVLLDVPETLQQEYQFTQGQNISFKKIIDGQELRRNYSICTAPYENELRVAIKKLEGGLFSTFANEQLKAGDTLEVMPPAGKFHTSLQPDQQKNYLAFAAGSGITPIISIIKTTLATEPGSQFSLVYGNRNSRSIIFIEQLEALKNKYMNRFTLIHILSREKTDVPLLTGRIDAAKLEELGKLIDYSKQHEFFACGPEQMIFSVRDFLLAKNIESRHIHFELFNTSKAVKGSVKKLESVKTAASHITIKLDGRTIEFDLPFSSESSLLDAALQQGADLPYACKGGMCCTCKAKLVEGEVQMDVSWGLEHDEVEQGYILTCQSHPKTEKLVVDFDIR